MKLLVRLLPLLLLALFYFGCSSSKTMHTQSVPDTAYHEALKATDPSLFDLPKLGSSEETAMLNGIKNLFTDYSHDNLGCYSSDNLWRYRRPRRCSPASLGPNLRKIIYWLRRGISGRLGSNLWQAERIWTIHHIPDNLG